MNENDLLAEKINRALAGAKDHAEAVQKLVDIGCTLKTASNYAAHHFDTHRGDVIDHSKATRK